MSLQPGSSSSTRRKMYKTGIDAEDSRRRREKELVGIRKIKRHTALLKKREETRSSSDTLLDYVGEIVKRVCDEYPHKQLEAAAHIRAILTLDDPAPPVDEFVKHGILPRFLELLSREDAPYLQVEVLWVISDFVSTSPQHKSAVVEVGGVPLLINLLSSTHDDIREEAMWILGTIVGDSPEYRDLVLSHGALMPLLCQLQPHASLYILRPATWCLSVLFLGIPPVKFEQVKTVLPALERLIHATDEDVLTDTCWTLAYLSDDHIENIEAIIELGICQKLVQLLQYPSNGVILPALEALGNIAAAGEAQTQFVIDNQLLPCLHQLLTREYTKNIFKEASCIIAVITSRTPAQIQAVIDANIIPCLVNVVHNAEFEVKKEAACAIFNVTSKGSDDNIRVLAAEGCIEALCQLLTCPDPKLVTVCLDGLMNIWAVGEANKDDNGNIFAQRVQECGGLDKIETLHLHENNEIHTKALWFSDCFRPENDELEDTDMSVSLLDFFNRSKPT